MWGSDCEAMEEARNSRLLDTASGVMVASGIGGECVRQRAIRMT